MTWLSGVRARPAGILTAWAIVVASGILYLQAHAARPGETGAPSPRWPVGSPIAIDGRRPALLIFLHPHCPCSRASLAELEKILRRCHERVSAHAILLATPLLDRWGRSAVVDQLPSLPGVRVWQDRGGALARRFGVATSGHVLVYDAGGLLIFSGGITAARGHAGDNLGEVAVIARIGGSQQCSSASPVFGCPLTTPWSSEFEGSRR
jgi:hypothetical protein